MNGSRAGGITGGLLFAGLGVATVMTGRGYGVGTPGNMGPGFFPVLLGALLALLGLLNAVAALRGAPAEADRVRIDRSLIRIGRALMLPLGIVVFGLLVERAGVILATLALVGCVSLAGYGFRLWEIAIVAAALVAIACLLFVYGLQLPTTYLLPS